MNLRKTACWCALGIIFATPSVAGELVYRPVNPSFGGDSFNSSHLLTTAEQQNRFQDDFANLFPEQTTAEEFADAIRASLIAGAASRISQDIFNNTAPGMNSITLDGATVTFETVGDRVFVTVSDGITTNTLDVPIAVPQN